MSLSAATTWEVRTSGSDSNGGGFVTGATGTDYSQQDAAQYSGTNLAIDAATASKVTSATHNFVSADVGNILQITAGSGFTAGFYQVVSVASNAATLDRSAGTLGSTGGTWALGGALASPGKAGGAIVAGNDIWIKSGTYAIGGGTVNTAGNAPSLNLAGAYNKATRWMGYGSTRGDGGTAPVLQATANSVSCFQLAGGSWYTLDNLTFDGNRGAGYTGTSGCGGIGAGYTGLVIRNCRAINCSGSAAFGPLFLLQGVVDNCEASGNGSGCYGFDAYVNNASAAGAFVRCTAHDNLGSGFRTQYTATVHCLAYNNGGDGFYASGTSIGFAEFFACTAVGNTGTGFNLTGASSGWTGLLLNCLAAQNGAYGIDANNGDNVMLLGCAGYSNTSGAYRVASRAAVKNFVTLTADPFVNAAGGDYSLNTTAGGGALARAAGLPGAFPGLSTTTGYPDIGAVQSQGGGGGGTARRVRG